MNDAVLRSVGKWLLLLTGIGVATHSCMPEYSSFGKGADDAASAMFPIVFGAFLLLVIATHAWVRRAQDREPNRSRGLWLLCLWPLAMPICAKLVWISPIPAAIVVLLIPVCLYMMLSPPTKYPGQQAAPATSVKAVGQTEKAAASQGTQD